MITPSASEHFDRIVDKLLHVILSHNELHYEIGWKITNYLHVLVPKDLVLGTSKKRSRIVELQVHLNIVER